MSRRRRRCMVCPKWDRGWCVHRAEMRPPDAQACDFGLREMKKTYFQKYYTSHKRETPKK